MKSLGTIFFLISLIFFSSQSFAKKDFVPYSYQLGSGDRLKITVFGEEDLSGEFEIDGSGILAFPLIGGVQAGGLGPRSLERLITQKLIGDYLVRPKVAVEVLNFRPFFILGEVNKPGSYPYMDKLTILDAVALAEGYTPRAKTNKILVVRGKGSKAENFYVEEDFSIEPGDSIKVRERLF
jgi:protein involved in polysaccharide export with SLBB domain